MAAYYNEIDPYAAQWLRNLIAAGHIAAGDVDERSIVEVRPDDVRGYTQCHFFAGIGVWSYALRLAGWCDDRLVWTGSCPCQPFSAAGKGDEFGDERHLWPVWFRLIHECRPVAVFGEQVGSKVALAWLDHVCFDLEAADYAVGAVDTCAAGFGAPHIRQRLYFVADAASDRTARHAGEEAGARKSRRTESAGSSATNELADAAGMGPRLGRLRDADAERCGVVGDAKRAGLAQQRSEPGAPRRPNGTATGQAAERASAPVNGFWRDAEWIACRDGKARPVEPGVAPLAHVAASRVGRLRAYGNAIVAEQAAAFIRAYDEWRLAA